MSRIRLPTTGIGGTPWRIDLPTTGGGGGGGTGNPVGGVVIGWVVANPSQNVEVLRAPDSAGSPDTANEVSLAVLPPGVSGYTDLSATVNLTFYHYRVRHVFPGYTAGTATRYIRVHGVEFIPGQTTPPPPPHELLFTAATIQSISRALRFMATIFQPTAETSKWSYGIGTLIPNVANSTQNFRAPVVLPAGVTIEAVAGRMSRTDATNDVAEMKFYRISDAGVATLLSTLTHTGTGASTVTDSTISEAVTTTQYVMTLELKSFATINDAAAIWFEISYIIPNYDAGY